MRTERLRFGIALAVSAALTVPLVACAPALPAGAPTPTSSPAPGLSVDISENGPNADTIAIPGGIAAGIERGLAALPGLIHDALDRSGVPGMAVAVVFDGDTVFAEGLGSKVAGADDPVDASTVFQIASVSKPITGTIIAKAISDGIVTWDTPVHDLLPDFALGDPYVTAHATVGDYMAHRSGLFTGAGDDLEALGFDRDTILDRLRQLPLAPFRSSYNYSNFGITIAGEAVATAAGTTWEELAERTLYGPLGMDSTSSRYDDFLARTNRATINALDDDGSFAPLYQRDPDPESPAGGVSSNVIDLAEWMKLVLAGGELDGSEYIAEDALLPAISGQVVSGRPGVLGQRGSQYGFGFNIGTELGGQPSIGHSGAFILGTGTNFRMLPGLGLGIVALTNGAPVGAAESVVASFTDIVLRGEPTRDWTTAYRGALAHYFDPEGDLVDVERPADPAPPGDLAIYAGVYRSPYFGELRVAVDGDGLLGRLGPTGAFELELSPWDGSVFAFDVGSEEAAPGSRSSAVFTTTGGQPATEVTLALFDKWGLGTFVRAG